MDNKVSADENHCDDKARWSTWTGAFTDELVVTNTARTVGVRGIVVVGPIVIVNIFLTVEVFTVTVLSA